MYTKGERGKRGKMEWGCREEKKREREREREREKKEGRGGGDGSGFTIFRFKTAKASGTFVCF